MPHLKFRGIKEEDLIKSSKSITDAMASIIGCEREHITIELQHTTFIFDGERVPAYPIVEVHWFDRDQRAKDEVAKMISDVITGAGYDENAVIFQALSKESYYDNGVHY